MPKEFKAGCARPTGGPVGEPVTKTEEKPTVAEKKEGKSMAIIGRKAPGFRGACVF